MQKANKPASKKQKGRRLEQWISHELRSSGADPEAKVMPGSGAFTHFKGDIYTKLGWHIEAKNQETAKVWEWWEQARNQAGLQKRPVVIFSRNYSEPKALLDARDFIALLAEVENLWEDLQKKHK